MNNAVDSEAPSQFEVVKKIKVPTLLLMGDREKGAIVSTEVAQERAKLIPDLQIPHLKCANHDIRRSKFNEYMAALKDFLDEV